MRDILFLSPPCALRKRNVPLPNRAPISGSNFAFSRPLFRHPKPRLQVLLQATLLYMKPFYLSHRCAEQRVSPSDLNATLDPLSARLIIPHLVIKHRASCACTILILALLPRSRPCRYVAPDAHTEKQLFRFSCFSVAVPYSTGTPRTLCVLVVNLSIYLIGINTPSGRRVLYLITEE